VRARSFITSGWLSIAAQLLVLAFLYAVGSTSPLGGGPATRAAALALIVLVPSVLWAAFFYALDRRHPEPTRHVLGAFILGMAAASLLALPAERYLFGLQEWMYRSLGALVLGSALVRGTLFGCTVYLGIRYGLLPSPEFDEPADGIVYGAAMGSGYAAVQSLAHLTAHPEFVLFAAAYTAAVNILVYASAGAAVGFFVGGTKFRPARSRRTMAGAVLIGVILVAAQHVLTEFVLVGGLGRAFWTSFVLTAAFAVVVVTAVTRLLGRFVPAPVQITPPSRWRPDWAVLAFVALLLGAAAIVRARLMHETFRGDELTFRYSPARLQPAVAFSRPAPGIPVFDGVGGVNGSGGVYTVSVRARREHVDLHTIDPASYLGAVEPLALRTGEVTIGGKAALRLQYAYLALPNDRLRGLPELRWAYTDIVPGESYTFVLSYQASPEAFERERAVYDEVLQSMRWRDDGVTQ